MTKYYCPSCNGELKIDYEGFGKILAKEGTLTINSCINDGCLFDYWYDLDGKIVNADYRFYKDNLSFWVRLEADNNLVIVSYHDYEDDLGEPYNTTLYGEYGIQDLNALVERTLKLEAFK